MARSDAILERLLTLHPKVIDLSLERIWRLLAAIGHPERRLPPVIHVAGTNGKGSVVANLRAMLEAAGKRVHVYTSPHLVRFHERIRLAGEAGGKLIGEAELSALLEECEIANRGEAITFFEITTAAAFLAFARNEADYLLLEVGLGGRLDATNVVDRPKLSVITAIDIDHQQFLGRTIGEIAAEKAGIMRGDVPCVIAPQTDEVLAVLEAIAAENETPVLSAGADWQAFEQHGRLVYQDGEELLDLTLPRLVGRHQIENAGVAIAALRALDDGGLLEQHIEAGLQAADWPGRLERLGDGALTVLAPEGSEIWVDGGHNGGAGRVVAEAMVELEERVSRPLVLICGMLNSKTPEDFLKPFSGLAHKVLTVTIPGEENALQADHLSTVARGLGLDALPAAGLDDALKRSAKIIAAGPPRILICGSLYLAGHVLAENAQTPPHEASAK